MDRTARKLLACLVVSPLGLLPITGCGNTDSQPAAQVENAHGIPPLFISTEQGMRAIEQQQGILPPKATLAERVIIPEVPRRLPPTEETPQASSPVQNAPLRVADAGAGTPRVNQYSIIPLPPVNETSAPADSTPYLASLPQSVVISQRPEVQRYESPSSSFADDELKSLDWPEDTLQVTQQSNENASQDRYEDFNESELQIPSPSNADLEIDSPSLVQENHPHANIPVPGPAIEEPAPQARATGLVNVPQVENSPAVEQIAPTYSDQQAESSRSKAMRVVSEQAAQHVRRGMSLASRGAPYSARSEFILAMRLISQALDVSNNNHAHTEALSNGLRALEEADDFVPRGTQLEADLNLAILIRSHRTPVLKDESPDQLRAIFARQSYYNYAQEQLALSVKGDRSGSMALFGLAKMRTELAKQQGDMAQLELPKAMALHQAALLTDNDNYMASNELGVLLARYGQYESARSLLEHSVQVNPQVASWHNLAVVYEHLGDKEQVAQARQQSKMLTIAERTNHSAHREIVWKQAQEFKETTSRNQAPVARKPAKSGQETNETR